MGKPHQLQLQQRGESHKNVIRRIRGGERENQVDPWRGQRKSGGSVEEKDKSGKNEEGERKRGRRMI